METDIETSGARRPGPIYLVRHGQTAWNREGRFQGQGDAPLTDLGIEQARSVGRRLRRELGDIATTPFVSSPLGRCRHTARLICEAAGWVDTAPMFDDRLKEIHFGRWEGMTVAEIEARDADEWAARSADKWHHPAPGGESYEDVSLRIAQWLTERPASTPTLAVCHGATGAVLRGLYLNLPPDEILVLDKPQGVVTLLSDGTETVLPGDPC